MYDELLGGVLFHSDHVEWYGVCDSVMFLFVDLCFDYGGVYVFHVCFEMCVVYGVGVCVNVYGVVCVVICLFLAFGWCSLVGVWCFCRICDVCSWRRSFMGSMCVLSCRCCVLVSVMHPVAILSAVFCVI